MKTQRRAKDIKTLIVRLYSSFPFCARVCVRMFQSAEFCQRDQALSPKQTQDPFHTNPPFN